MAGAAKAARASALPQTLHLNRKGRKARGETPVISGLESLITRMDLENFEGSSRWDF
jgi:hypothetical protein